MTTAAGGAPGRRPPPAGAPPRRPRAEQGSQTVELALALPLVVFLLTLLLHGAVLGADVVVVHGLAREAARSAAVSADADVAEALAEALGTRPHELVVEPGDHRRRPGDLVTARVRMASRAFAAFGHDVWLEARATMRVEDVP